MVAKNYYCCQYTNLGKHNLALTSARLPVSVDPIGGPTRSKLLLIFWSAPMIRASMWSSLFAMRAGHTAPREVILGRLQV